MSKVKSKNNLVMKSNENQKPFDVVMNEHFEKCFQKGYKNETSHSRMWFIPIVKEQSVMDDIMNIKSQNNHWTNDYDLLSEIFPKIQLEVNTDDEGNISSIYVLYSKGGKLYRVVSQKDYGIIKSRMELKNGKYVPYEKCDLVPFSGVVKHMDKGDRRIVSSISYKNGVKDGECYKYYSEKKEWNYEKNRNEYITPYEKTTFKNGKRNGEFENTFSGEKGNYINNKKNGEWKVKQYSVKHETYSPYETKFSKKDSDVVLHIHYRNLSDIFLDTDDIIIVNYVDGVLNGKFKSEWYKGEFHMGLLNGLVSLKNYYNRNLNTLYLDGIRKSSVSFGFGRDCSSDKEDKYEICSYNSLGTDVKESITLSTDGLYNIPKPIKSKTEKFLTEDLYNSIIKHQNNMLNDSLEQFRRNWVVTDISSYELEIIKHKKNENKLKSSIRIKRFTPNYLEVKSDGYWNDEIQNYFIEECGYPYYDEIGYEKKLIRSNEYRNVYYYHGLLPKLFMFSQSGEPNKVFLNGEVLDEYIGEEINPILINFQKEQYQLFSDEMKSSYEKQLKKEERKKKSEEKQKQKEREKNGLLSSFPMD